MKPTVGFLGTGIMGSGMVQNLLRSGYSVSIWNRSPEKTKECIAAGAVLRESPRAVSEKSDILMLCVTNEAVVQDVLFNSDTGAATTSDLSPIIIDFSTINPEAALTFATRLQEIGIEYLDAPVSGGDIGARNGTLTIMVGGAATAFESIAPLLAVLGSQIIYTGASGTGQKTKCINQIVVALTVLAMTEGLYLAEQAGLDLAQTLSIIRGGAAGSWALENYAPRVLAGDLAPGFRARDMLKDLGYVTDLAKSTNTHLPGLDLTKKLYEALVNSEIDSTLGNHALIKHYRDDPGSQS